MENATISPRNASERLRDGVTPQKAANPRMISPSWERAFKNFRAELDADDNHEILVGTRTLDDLTASTRTLQVSGPDATNALKRLGSKLKFVDDFSVLVALCPGANETVVAAIWGSLRLIITRAVFKNDPLQKVLDVLEELSLSLPRFRYYEESLPLNLPFENSPIDLYSENICFYARLIRHYKIDPHLPFPTRNAEWQSLEKDLAITVRRVEHLSSIIEKEADLAKMRMEREECDEVLGKLTGLGSRQPRKAISQWCCHIPVNFNPRVKGRETELEIVRQALDPDTTPTKLKSFALYGMGGVGKTQLALRYALEAKKHFDTILWISADSYDSLEQSFREAALCLGLDQQSSSGASELSTAARVKAWLSDCSHGRNWLLVFDDANDITLLRHVWPGNGLGSVLLTSRDFKAASTLASQGLNLQPFSTDTGAAILLQLLGLDAPSDDQKTEACKIATLLGGLPLAVDQIAGFISQRKIRLQDFIPMYERHGREIDKRRHWFNGYPHTVDTVFDLSLTHLFGRAPCLLKLVAFFEPDSIAESIFEDGASLVQDPDFEFLGNKLDLGDAEEQLLELALVNKDGNEKTLSIHRLVQIAVLRRIDDVDMRKCFDIAVGLLSLGFPETWSKDVGHQKKQWARSEQYFPHVNALVRFVRDNHGLVTKSDAWRELLLSCSWYLYEREQYTCARTFTQMALDNFTSERTPLAYASAIDLLGLIDLDLSFPVRALASFETGLVMRRELLAPTDPLIAFALNNLAVVHTELTDLPKAEEHHRQAIELRLQNRSDRIGNSYSNYAVTLLRMGQPDEAERTLMSSPNLQEYTDETLLQADNPRFVGDMVLLSRIRSSQGRNSDALRLASKALTWRQKMHGDRYKTCDSMYDVACLLNEQGQMAKALDFLDSLTSIAATLENGEGHMARAEHKVSQIYKAIGRDEDSLAHLKKATALRETFRGAATDDASSEHSGEHSWDRLTPYMLW